MYLFLWRKFVYMWVKWFVFYKCMINVIVQKISNDGFFDIFCIVVRDYGWDFKYIDVMEVDYFRGGERWIVKDFKNFVCKNFIGVFCKFLVFEFIKSIVDNNEWQFLVLKLRVF